MPEYDGDGNRVKKTEGGETTLYINQYYEKNLTTSVVTTHYYLGGKEMAYRVGTTLRYPLDDLRAVCHKIHDTAENCQDSGTVQTDSDLSLAPG